MLLENCDLEVVLCVPLPVLARWAWIPALVRSRGHMKDCLEFPCGRGRARGHCFGSHSPHGPCFYQGAKVQTLARTGIDKEKLICAR